MRRDEREREGRSAIGRERRNGGTRQILRNRITGNKGGEGRDKKRRRMRYGMREKEREEG